MNSRLRMCERCGQAAYFVHHKEYIKAENINDSNITLNWNNLECLCKKCHNEEHFKEKQEYYFDENGDLVYKGEEREGILIKNKDKANTNDCK